MISAYYIGSILISMLLLLFASPAVGADMSACSPKTSGTVYSTPCLLWSLAANTRQVQGDSDWRTTGPVPLEDGSSCILDYYVGRLNSTRPSKVRVRRFDAGDTENPTEEWLDYGMNGLEGTDVHKLRTSEAPDVFPDLSEEVSVKLNQDYNQLLQNVHARLNISSVHESIDWTKISPGLEFGKTVARRFIRLGVNEVILLRFDPKRYGLEPLSDVVDGRPKKLLTVEGWAETDPRVAAVFNSGQYYSDYRYIGLQMKDGCDLGSGLHKSWKGLLLSGGPMDDPENPPTTIHDLQMKPFDPTSCLYKHGLQSFMLLDSLGNPRVRYSDRQASRTAIAQDKDGRMLVVVVPGACTLYELALFLKYSELNIEQAMGLDGGLESQFMVRANPEVIAYYGAYVINENRQFKQEGLKLPLPAAVGVIPLSE